MSREVMMQQVMLVALWTAALGKMTSTLSDADGSVDMSMWKFPLATMISILSCTFKCVTMNALAAERKRRTRVREDMTMSVWSIANGELFLRSAFKESQTDVDLSEPNCSVQMSYRLH